MTNQEAERIFKEWQEFAEINDKLFQLFSTSIPESFLPYSKEILEEVMNVVAKRYFDAGDHEATKLIQRQMTSVMFYKDDEEALNQIVDGWVLKGPEIRTARLRNLRAAQESWAKFKEERRDKTLHKPHAQDI